MHAQKNCCKHCSREKKEAPFVFSFHGGVRAVACFGVFNFSFSLLSNRSIGGTVLVVTDEANNDDRQQKGNGLFFR
jgi:hypothetical protein